MQSETLLGTAQSDLEKAVKKTGTVSMNMLDNNSDFIVNNSQTGRKISTNEVIAAATRCCKLIDHGDGIPIKKCKARPPEGCNESEGWHEE